MTWRATLLIAAMIAVLINGLGLAFATPASSDSPDQDDRVVIKVKVANADRVELAPGASGKYRFIITGANGHSTSITADEFADRLYRDRVGRGWLFVLLNITTPIGVAWVSLGLFGQVLFTVRMLVQWIVSERSRRSVVPVAFWWFSLVGATMLLAYFVWRKDIVGVLGQTTGWFIYTRNLWLIYAQRHTQRGAARGRSVT